MTHYNCAVAEPEERDLQPATHNLGSARPTVPVGFALYLGDIQACLLRATAANEAMIYAKLENDLPAMARNCGIAVEETRAASALASRLTKHISAHQRRHEGGAKQ